MALTHVSHKVATFELKEISLWLTLPFTAFFSQNMKKNKRILYEYFS